MPRNNMISRLALLALGMAAASADTPSSFYAMYLTGEMTLEAACSDGLAAAVYDFFYLAPKSPEIEWTKTTSPVGNGQPACLFSMYEVGLSEGYRFSSEDILNRVGVTAYIDVLKVSHHNDFVEQDGTFTVHRSDGFPNGCATTADALKPLFYNAIQSATSESSSEGVYYGCELSIKGGEYDSSGTEFSIDAIQAALNAQEEIVTVSSFDFVWYSEPLRRRSLRGVN